MSTETRNGLTFQQWRAAVDKILLAKVGMSADDLADFNSYDAWDSEMTPDEGARECLESDDLCDDELIDELW